MNFKSILIVFAGALAGCSVIRPGMQYAKPVDPSAEKARAIYAEIVKKLSSAQSVTLSFDLDEGDRSGYYSQIGSKGSFTFQKPNSYKIDWPDRIEYAVGDEYTVANKGEQQYAIRSPLAEGEMDVSGFSAFEPLITKEPQASGNVIEMAKLNGQDTVLVHGHHGNTTYDAYYSTETKLPIQCIIRPQAIGEKETYRYSKVILNPTLSHTTFEVDVKHFPLNDEGGQASIRIGSKIPSFEIKTVDSQLVSSKILLASKKAVILSFWTFGWGGSCSAELPHLDKLYSQLKSQGLFVLAVCDNGTVEEVKQSWKDESMTLPCAMNGTGSTDLSKKLGVAQEPVIVVVDSTGTVVAVFGGYYPDKMKQTLGKLGIQY